VPLLNCFVAVHASCKSVMRMPNANDPLSCIPTVVQMR
jgi:hypothetical protein